MIYNHFLLYKHIKGLQSPWRGSDVNTGDVDRWKQKEERMKITVQASPLHTVFSCFRKSLTDTHRLKHYRIVCPVQKTKSSFNKCNHSRNSSLFTHNVTVPFCLFFFFFAARSSRQLIWCKWQHKRVVTLTNGFVISGVIGNQKQKQWSEKLPNK